jgi:hypothetical protein
MSNNTPDIALNITTTQITGYKSTTSSNGTIYYYQYTGGNDGNGGIDVTVSNGTDNVKLSLNTFPSTVSIVSDPNGVQFFNSDGSAYTGADLSWELKNKSEIEGIITDKSNTTGNYKYSVFLSDSSGNQPNTFTCDPEIINKPKPPVA